MWKMKGTETGSLLPLLRGVRGVRVKRTVEKQDKSPFSSMCVYNTHIQYI